MRGICAEGEEREGKEVDYKYHRNNDFLVEFKALEGTNSILEYCSDGIIIICILQVPAKADYSVQHPQNF